MILGLQCQVEDCKFTGLFWAELNSIFGDFCNDRRDQAGQISDVHFNGNRVLAGTAKNSANTCQGFIHDDLDGVHNGERAGSADFKPQLFFHSVWGYGPDQLAVDTEGPGQTFVIDPCMAVDSGENPMGIFDSKDHGFNQVMGEMGDQSLGIVNGADLGMGVNGIRETACFKHVHNFLMGQTFNPPCFISKNPGPLYKGAGTTLHILDPPTDTCFTSGFQTELFSGACNGVNHIPAIAPGAGQDNSGIRPGFSKCDDLAGHV